MFDRTYGNVCEDHDVHFVQILGRKRNPRNRSDYVVLVLDSVAAGEKGGNQKAARISVGPIHAKNGYAFADDGNHVAQVVRSKVVVGNLSGNSGRAGIVKGDEQRDRFGGSSFDEGYGLGVNLNAVYSTPHFEVGDRFRSVVANGGLVTGGRALAQNPRDKTEFGNGQVLPRTR